MSNSYKYKDKKVNNYKSNFSKELSISKNH